MSCETGRRVRGVPIFGYFARKLYRDTAGIPKSGAPRVQSVVAGKLAANQNLPAFYIDFGYGISDAVFALTVAFVTCLLAGLLPAWSAMQVTPAIQLKSQ